MKIRLFFIALIGIVFFSTSCSKSKIENKIIGDWEQISVGQIPENTKITLTFSADHQLFRTIVKDEITSIDTAEWSLDVKVAQKNLLTIENLDVYMDGVHRIHTLNDYLRMQRVEFTNGHSDGSFYWTEFEKK